MLGSAAPATASVYTETTPASPTRPSRLRGLSYHIRNYTNNHLHSSSPNPESRPPLTARSTSSPSLNTTGPAERVVEAAVPSPTIQSGENGWIPTIQGRSGLSRESAHPTSTSTASASPEPRSLVGMVRSRAATALVPSAASVSQRNENGTQGDSHTMTGPASNREQTQSSPTIRLIPHVEPRSPRPSLHFATVARTLTTTNSIVRVGRYSERDHSTGDPATLPVGFKSKVVSRRHCEFWCTDGQWYIKDVKSSSGTFLNHVRLSSPGVESRPYPVNDGDVVQLGIDFKGGEEVIFRCVKIRVECNRGWQKSLNNFNMSAQKRLMRGALKGNRDSDVASVNSSECSICLNAVAPCQALFVAPCSHVWHYKCIRNLIPGPNYPNFLCPNCRFVADLEADVEQPEAFEYDENDFESVLPQPDEQSVASGQPAELPEQEASDDLGDQNRETSIPQINNGNETDWADSDMLRNLSLQPNAPASPTGPVTLSVPETSAAATNNNSNGTKPIRIVQAARSSRSTSAELLGRSPTPTSSTQFALSAGHITDGPLTPRNDAGPFVFDGSAGRENENGRASPTPGADEQSRSTGSR